MKKFIGKVVLFTALFVLSMMGVMAFDYFVIGNQYLGNYQASLIDKTERLQTIDEAKIILIGNSNVCFGVNSEMIEEAFDMPVVDMGLHGGLGNAFHENMVKLGVSKGDIVILCHSNYSDDDTIGDSELAWITLEFHKELWGFLRQKDILTLLKAYPRYFMNAFLLWIRGESGNTASDETCYSRSAFNKYGDISRRFDDTYEFTETSVVVPEINDTCINRINKLNEYIREQGATLLIAGYPIGYGEYTPDASEYDSFEKELREKVDCDVISHYTDYFIPYEFFYNTNLHLSEEGAEIRTKLLIEDLSNWKKEQGNS
jgi:hypothetical protein